MMNASKASASAERLEIARRLYNALVAQDPNRVIILCDSNGRVGARHDLRLEQIDLLSDGARSSNCSGVVDGGPGACAAMPKATSASPSVATRT